MANISMIAEDKGSFSSNTKTYFKKITQVVTDDPLVSDVVLMPSEEILAIAVSLSGTGTIAFTADPVSEIDGATATWVDWNGSAVISNAVTAYKVTATSGTVVSKVTVKVRS